MCIVLVVMWFFGLLTLAVVTNAATELPLHAVNASAHGGGEVRSVDFAGSSLIVSGGEDSQVITWDLSLSLQHAATLNYTIYELEASVDGTLVVAGEGGWNGGAGTDTFVMFQADPLIVEASIDADIGYVYVVSISPDNTKLAASGYYGNILILNATTMEILETVITGRKRTKALAWSPTGEFI